MRPGCAGAPPGLAHLLHFFAMPGDGVAPGGTGAELYPGALVAFGAGAVDAGGVALAAGAAGPAGAAIESGAGIEGAIMAGATARVGTSTGL